MPQFYGGEHRGVGKRSDFSEVAQRGMEPVVLNHPDLPLRRMKLTVK